MFELPPAPAAPYPSVNDVATDLLKCTLLPTALIDTSPPAVVITAPSTKAATESLLVTSEIDTPSEAPTGTPLSEIAVAPDPTVELVLLLPSASTLTAISSESSKVLARFVVDRTPAVIELFVVTLDDAPAVETATETEPTAAVAATAIDSADSSWLLVA